MERAHPATISIVMTTNNWGLHVESGLLTKDAQNVGQKRFFKTGDELLQKLNVYSQIVFSAKCADFLSLNS
jgi:hypothetical protein